MITKLILPDGSTVSSGIPGQAAITAFSYSQSVSAGTELEPGACCAAMVRLEILGHAPLQENMELKVYRDERLLGRFIIKEILNRGQRLSVTAYDRVTLLDRDLTAWLRSKTDWPCSMQALARQVCEACGLELKNEPVGEYVSQAFGCSFVTGRQLMQWIGQVCGCFFLADEEGKLECGWYRPTDHSLTARDYYQGTLQLANYRVLPIEQVRLTQSATDVGVSWPMVTEAVNTYLLRGNPLLDTGQLDALESVARQLYERLSTVTYTPCTVTVEERTGIRAGDIIQVENKTVYVMSVRIDRGRLQLSCTGSARRTDSANVTVSQKELTGRVLELSTRMDGITAENRDGAGKLSRLSMTVDGLAAQVSTALHRDSQRLTSLEQTAQALTVQVRQVTGQVVTDTGYTFDSQGLKIAHSGSEMENCLDHSGMYVRRAGETILQANTDGVVAADVQVRNFLHIGKYARLEDYAGRTACFYVGGYHDQL